MVTTELIAFITARLDEDAWWARNAGAGGWRGHVPPETGEHWQWEATEDDTVLKIDPTAGEYADDVLPEGGTIALRSVETYGAGDRPLPSFLISHAEEVNAVAAGHIARHDPARVLREVEAKRALLVYLVDLEDKAGDGNWWNLDTDLPLKLLAAPYSDHPDYRREFAP